MFKIQVNISIIKGISDMDNDEWFKVNGLWFIVNGSGDIGKLL